MSYMLVQYTTMSKMTTDIIDRYQPVTNITSEALKHTQTSVNLLHEHLLDYDISKIDAQLYHLNHMKEDVTTLIEYAKIQKLKIDTKPLIKAITIADEINKYTEQIRLLSNNYDKNHPVIAYATESLNPIGLQYQGLINGIIDESKELELSPEAIILLSNMRHSWSQLMSHMRTVITTRNQTSINNVYTYSDVNLKQLNQLKKMDLDIGIYQLSDLQDLREKYLSKIEYVREKIKVGIWRTDNRIMINKIMPLFNNLKEILNKTLKVEMESAEIANKSLINEISKIDFIYILIIFSGTGLAFVISVFITRSLRQPLKKLVSATENVAQGNLESYVNITSSDEISQLYNSFNDMLDKLKQSKNQILKEKEKAEEANQFKSKFLRSMSHELRTPMNAVLGYSQLLSMESLTDDQKKFVGEISKSGNHLLDLINQVLDLARIESGKIEMELQTIEISNLINDCIPLINNSTAQSRNIQIINNTTDLNHTIIADQLSLRQILINLLSNAVKYNKDNGSIRIDAEETDNYMICISITDTGVGLDPDEIKHIYEPFQRLGFMNSAIEGSGIGLTITRQLIEQMGGEIGVESEKNTGSKFWITLPLAKYECITENNITKDKQTDIDYLTKVTKQFKILYVEDNPANYNLMKAILSKYGKIILIHAETAEDGLNLLDSSKPDIIFMDINLPGMTGYEALHLIKNNTISSHIPVVAVSANALADDIQNGLNSGFDHYLTKPIDISQLKNTISQYTQSFQ
ncbi:MAG: ATP-binding protein [Gammaproteobacteria bacterium]|nr:ATP-binding protein [Gammaproteobacteria bacterium]MCW9055852.1 ATP-binding protein [Gammaproteobacteria bacterium]